MDIQQQKEIIRKEIGKKRAALSENDRLSQQQWLNQQLIAVVEQLAPEIVLSYLPFRSEVDITPFNEWCWKQKIRLWLPKVNLQDKQLTLHEFHQDQLLTINPWGIREPAQEDPIEYQIEHISTIVVPGMAFDRKKGRLGYGGGYYDRLMEQFHNRQSLIPFKVSVAFDVQMISEVPYEQHDFRIDHLITYDSVR
jgi:5-formyltetrahydrofolate cyclo-ligase